MKQLGQKVCWLLISGIALVSVVANANGQVEIDFAHDVLPLFQKRCASCHSNGQYKGGLSLETRASLLESGTVEVGSRAQSDLFDRLRSADEDYRMPPEGEPLTDAEIEAVGKWIDQGLRWPAGITLKKKTFQRPLQLREGVAKGKELARQHPIDWHVDRYFKTHGLTQPKQLSDAAYLRRVKLDLLGLLPTFEELEAVRQGPLNRQKLVDDLVGRNRDYADHWLTFWNDLLRNDYVGTGYIDGGRTQITQWLHRSLLENKPYDQFVTELINPSPASSGFIKGIQWRGRVNASQVRELQFSQNISQVFLGINMKCASCHDSFIDQWKLDDAYGLAAVIADQPLEVHRCDVPTGETATSQFVFPSLGNIDASRSKSERLGQLATLMTDKRNGRFSRTIVNRLWHRMVGRGLVHPVDVMANKAWSEPLLDFLAQDLVEHGYDLKRTLKLIATSSIYQSQAFTNTDTAPSGDTFVFAGVGAKRMTAEQFVDAVWRITGAGPHQPDAKLQPLTSEPGLVQGNWIWSSKENARVSPPGETIIFRKLIELKALPARATAVVACDNRFTAYVNGKQLGRGDNWMKPVTMEFQDHLEVGRNELMIKARNDGETPNPAALFVEALVGSEKDGQTIATDKSWQWTDQAFKPGVPQPGVAWRNADVVEPLNGIYGAAAGPLTMAVAAMSQQKSWSVRAALVKSDALMRSLGRPNREQVVTTRPDELSTLQALDLTNGALLSGWLKQGARRWQARMKQHQWSEEALIRRLFLEALSRPPTEQELSVLATGTLLDPESQLEAMEDTLWMVLMLPEFQLIR